MNVWQQSVSSGQSAVVSQPWSSASHYGALRLDLTFHLTSYDLMIHLTEETYSRILITTEETYSRILILQ